MLKTIRAMGMAVALLAAAGSAQAAAVPVTDGTDGVAVERPADRGTLTFSSTASSEGGQAESATGGTGSISFQGSIQTSTPCFNVTGSHRERGSRIVVTVTAAPTDGICAQVITYHNYSGAVSGLAAGTYDFQIVEAVGGRSTTVLSQQVTVS
ncbi:MAG: hypothetical protein AB1941_13570 [Gemmatimonadota bacterium]